MVREKRATQQSSTGPLAGQFWGMNVSVSSVQAVIRAHSRGTNSSETQGFLEKMASKVVYKDIIS
jgi:hypothetical protein